MKLPVKISLQLLLWLWCEQVLPDVAAGSGPDSDSLLSDANLMFEFLLGGVEVDSDKNLVLVDKEMASMRSGRALLSQLNDNIPRNPDSMEQMVIGMERQRKRPLSQQEFDSVVLSMVYSAHQAWQLDPGQERASWGDVILRLANVTVYELRGSHLFSYA